jgi:hypothetical protein
MEQDFSELEHFCLCVGLDDSNHGGTNAGEGIVASFSFFYEDSIVKNYGKGKDKFMVLNWLNNGGNKRDVRYCILKADRFRRSSQNLAYAAPYLVNDFLKTCPSDMNSLKMYLDGSMTKESKENLRKEFEPKVKSFVVDNFPKKERVHYCPFVVYASHVISNRICRGDEAFIQSSKQVDVPE